MEGLLQTGSTLSSLSLFTLFLSVWAWRHSGGVSWERVRPQEGYYVYFRQLERNSRQFETTYMELETIIDNLKGI